MRFQPAVLLVPALLVGCGGSAPAPSKATQQAGAASMAAATQQAATTDNAKAEAKDEEKNTAESKTAVPLSDGEANLSPENTKIEFVGTHTGDKPEPRTGGFEKFSGKIAVDGGTLKSISFEIDADSMWTEFGKLTTHLKSPDFFDTKEYPQIKFESTKVDSMEPGIVVTGNLTLHGETKSITVPATLSTSGDGVTLSANFKIDRTEFGMNFEPTKVEKEVSLTVAVGEKNAPKVAPPGT